MGEIKIWYPTPAERKKEVNWLKKEIEDIGKARMRQMADIASRRREYAYAQYSGYKVGATLLSVSGSLHEGQNIESAGYSGTIHAEKAAIIDAINLEEMVRSGRKFIRAIAVSHIGDSAPCGQCRQDIIEHCDNAVIIIADENGQIRRVTSLRLLLPDPFTPTHLGIK